MNTVVAGLFILGFIGVLIGTSLVLIETVLDLYGTYLSRIAGSLMIGGCVLILWSLVMFLIKLVYEIQA